MKNKIIVFGATGGTGLQLVKQALAKNYQVTAFVRDPSKITIRHEKLTIEKGDVLYYPDVLKAIENQDAVFCCLGMPASDRSELRKQGTQHIVNAMKEKNKERFICQTSLGFGDSTAILPWHMKYLIVPFILKHAFADHAQQEEVIENSSLKWSIIRPGNMTNGQLTRRYKHGFSISEKIKLKVSRSDVAHFMIEELEKEQYLYKKAGISY